ncbi:MAG: hypothetical protein ACQEXC_13295, partial [Pseudomonadota bacterium]
MLPKLFIRRACTPPGKTVKYASAAGDGQTLQAVKVAEVIVLYGLFLKRVESLRNIPIDNHGIFGKMCATDSQPSRQDEMGGQRNT